MMRSKVSCKFREWLPPSISLVGAWLVAGFFTTAAAQNSYREESAKIFANDDVATIKVDIKQAYLGYILHPANAESDSLFPARVIFQNAQIAGDTLENVGFRLRGNTSRYSQKKSFKLDFNEFIKGQKLHGLEKLNLNGEHNDPSILRSLLCWDLFNKSGVPAARAGYAALYINSEFKGLYLMVEHYDEEFVLSRFGNNDGNLYKCLWPADLTYLGPDPAAYKKMRNTRQRVYELKINTETDDYSDLIAFIAFLNISMDADFAREIEERFNVHTFLQYLAVNTLLGSWDDYWYLKNNYYLYHNSATGKFEFIPYDYDNTYGVDFVGGDWGTRDLYNFGNAAEARPLVTRILAIPGYRNLYSANIKEALQSGFAYAAQSGAISQWRALAAPWMQIDTYYPRDYGFTIADWQNAVEVAWGGHVEYGIRPYIETRSQTATAQLQEGPLPATISEVHVQPEQVESGQDINVTCRIGDRAGAQAVELLYTVGGAPPAVVVMADDGQHFDGAAKDNLWGGTIPGQTAGKPVAFYLRAHGGAGSWTIYPASAPQQKIVVPYARKSFPLFINEFMASNDTTVTDEFGEHDDWVEIYNAADSAVSVSGLYLSDNLAKPTKWQFPDTTLPAKSFLLVWADDQAGQGPAHAPYKLSADGEQIGIFGPDSLGNIPIDTLRFGPQTTDISYGRTPDGGDTWVYFSSATPGHANATATGVVPPARTATELDPKSFRIERLWPNPATDFTRLRLQIRETGLYTVSVYDLLGRQVQRWQRKILQPGAQDVAFQFANLHSGVYFVRVQTGKQVAFTKLTIVR